MSGGVVGDDVADIGLGQTGQVRPDVTEPSALTCAWDKKSDLFQPSNLQTSPRSYSLMDALSVIDYKWHRQLGRLSRCLPRTPEFALWPPRFAPNAPLSL
jgi:hypothetical protein